MNKMNNGSPADDGRLPRDLQRPPVQLGDVAEVP
jgi:hypothetical protein